MKNRFFAAAILMLTLFSALGSTALAAGSPMDEIRAVKLWQGDETASRPESITLHLYADGELKDSLTLSGDADSQSWLGSFGMQPVYRSGGVPISYTVREESPEGYSGTVTQQPAPAALSLSSWGEKITPASESSYPLSGNMLVAKKGGDYFVWTRAELDSAQKEQLIFLINAASLQGLGKALSLENTLFRSGLPAVFEDSGVSINKDAGSASADFDKTSSWSLFYSGLLGIRKAREALIENTFSLPAPTVRPTPSPVPTPEAETLSLGVKKLWLMREGDSRPDTATVQLYKDGEPYAQISLSEANGWQHTWEGLEASAKWSVREAEVPEGFVSSVSREGNLFTVTNISKSFPATGDVSAAEFYAVSALLCLMLLGILLSIPVIKRKKDAP